mmetsp:Transcript_12194/g.27571  ORF Transcript_12194/g.27571 Transcript_12194/m.27571 type:complete len:641 (-) Transcript_12194:64-1986(-)
MMQASSGRTKEKEMRCVTLDDFEEMRKQVKQCGERVLAAQLSLIDQMWENAESSVLYLPDEGLSFSVPTTQPKNTHPDAPALEAREPSSRAEAANEVSEVLLVEGTNAEEEGQVGARVASKDSALLPVLEDAVDVDNRSKEELTPSQKEPLTRSHFLQSAFPTPSSFTTKEFKESERKSLHASSSFTGISGLEGYLKQMNFAEKVEELEEAHPLFKQIFGPLVHLFLRIRAKSLEVSGQMTYFKYFEFWCVMVIIVNCGLLWYITDEEIDGVASTGDWKPQSWTSTLEVGFLVWYGVEIAIKLYLQRVYFLFSDDALWNISDCVLVLFSISEIVSSRTKGINVSYLRGMRILRVVKLFRMFRVLRMIQEIKLLVDCVVGSINSLIWSFVLLCLVLSFFSMFFVSAVSNSLRDNNLDPLTRVNLIDSFSTVREGMVTLFMCVSGGKDWSETYFQLRATSTMNGYIFLAMVIAFYIAVWNVVSSIFVERAMRIATPSLQQQMAEKKVRDDHDARDFYRVCKRLDEDDSGTLSCEEFSKFTSNPEFKQYFEVSGLDVRNAENFFHSLTKVTGVQEMDLGLFVSVCMRLRGMASSVDVHMLMVEMRIIYAEISSLKDTLNHRARKGHDVQTSIAKDDPINVMSI